MYYIVFLKQCVLNICEKWFESTKKRPGHIDIVINVRVKFKPEGYQRNRPLKVMKSTERHYYTNKDYHERNLGLPTVFSKSDEELINDLKLPTTAADIRHFGGVLPKWKKMQRVDYVNFLSPEMDYLPIYEII